ncbi:hypothetical protein [Pimelobacter simplex]|uniref:hypothetical protein n=1 Tax=Nocardioides simplex TaxID=2045 RepID=UPI001934B295|nr:hypothetical protein [Pimelobacter simplex]
MSEPLVYFKPGCPFGLRLRIALALHRVPHRSVRFRDDEDGAARVRAVNDGNEISPTVQVAGRWLTNPSWREVRRAVRETGPLRSGGSLVLVTAAVLLAGCGSGDEAASEPPAPASALEGTWRAGPLTLADTVATIRAHGLDPYVKAYRENAPFSGDTVLSLTIEDGEWDLYGTTEGREPAPIDYDAEYEIDDATVVFHHSDGSNTYRWQVDHDTLTLHFVESTLPGYRGIPDEVFQRALYMTSAFTRQD